MSGARFAILLLAGLGLVGLGLSAFTVDEREYAIKFRFGEIVQSDFEPGLHFKVPIVNNIRKFPRQILTVSPPAEDILTTEKKTVVVDFFVKWRITDPVRYYTSTRGSEEAAVGRLQEIVKAAIRTEFAKRTVQEVISLERAELMRDMTEDASSLASELGISLVDVRVKRVEFPQRVAESVYRRMREERARVAAELRAEGKELAEQIRANADRRATVIRSEAYREAQRIRGEGDAESASIYAAAYNQDPEFYAFYRSIEAYKRAMGQPGDLLVLDPKNDFFRYLNSREGE